MVNDKKYGGVFRSSDGGAHWEQLGSGLDGRDVFALARNEGWPRGCGNEPWHFCAGWRQAIRRPQARIQVSPRRMLQQIQQQMEQQMGRRAAIGALTWQPRNTIANTVTKTVTQTHMHTKVNIEKQVQAPTIAAGKHGERAGCFRRCVGGSDRLRSCDQPRPGRELAGRPGDGRGRLSVCDRARLTRWSRLAPIAL